MAQSPRHIPINEDLSVYAYMVERFQEHGAQSNYALVILAQRVLVERLKVQRKLGRIAEIQAEISRINQDPVYRSQMAAAVGPGSSLLKTYPQYGEAGLIKGQ